MWIESVLQMCMVSWPGQLGEYCSLKSRLDVLSSCSCNWNLATKHCQERGREREREGLYEIELNWVRCDGRQVQFSSVEFSWVKLSDCVSVGPRVFDWWRHFPFQKFAPPTRSPSRVFNWLDTAAATAADSGAGHVEPQWSCNWEKGERCADSSREMPVMLLLLSTAHYGLPTPAAVQMNLIEISKLSSSRCCCLPQLLAPAAEIERQNEDTWVEAWLQTRRQRATGKRQVCSVENVEED